jgi:prepilin-type N-terminal cleavage/methylation domain-containing protein
LTTGRNDKLRARRRAAGGFTLLELVLAMVVICTVLAMAAPSLRGFFSSHKVTDAAAEMVALTQLARSLAASEGRVYRLNLDPARGTYWLTAQRQGTFERARGEFGRVFRLPDGVRATWQAPTLGQAEGHVQFYPNGMAEQAAIRIEGRQGEVADVICPSAAEPFEVRVASEAT